MAKKDEIEKRRKMLLELLLSSPNGISITELEIKLGIKERRIQDAIIELRSMEVEIEYKKGIVKLVETEKAEKLMVCSKSNRQIIRQLRILTVFSSSDEVLNETEIREKVYQMYKAHNIEDPGEPKVAEERKENRDKTLQADLKELVEKNYLIENNKVYKLGFNTPVKRIMLDTEPEEIFNLIKEHADSFPTSLMNIAEQLKLVMENKLLYDTPSLQPSNIIVDGKKSLVEITEELLKNFSSTDFKNNLVYVEYAVSDRESLNIRFATGLMVYSIDRGKMYLLGKEIIEESSNNIILDVQKIKKIEKAEAENKHYMSDEFMQMYDEMFSVSVEEPYEVEVVFSDVFQIGQKLKHLEHGRKYASLTFENGSWVYRDTVRGLSDFAKYLRSFGMSCRVVKPDILVERMYESAKKIYQLYQVDEMKG